MDNPRQPAVAAKDSIESVSVVLADDHELFRAGLARAIAAHPELELVAQASTGIEALAAIQKFDPDVALVDVRMPGIDGLDVCDRVASHQPPLRTRIVLVTAFPDDVVAARAVTLGATGLLGKESSRAQVCAVLLEAGRSEDPASTGRVR